MRGSPQMMIGRSISDLVDLGVPGQQILDEQAVLEELHQLAVPADDARGAEVRLLAERPAQHVEAVTECAVAEVAGPGLLDRRRGQGVGLERAPGGDLHQAGPELIDLGAEAGAGQVVEDHRCRSPGHDALLPSDASSDARSDSDSDPDSDAEPDAASEPDSDAEPDADSGDSGPAAMRMTRAVGRTGVISGRNQRNQIRPLG